jgi:hypothetical protein
MVLVFDDIKKPSSPLRLHLMSFLHFYNIMEGN